MSYRFRHWIVRDDMLESLHAYVQQGRPVGDFLRGILENNFTEACGHADGENMENLPAFAAWLYNDCPNAAWGSREKVSAWLARHAEARRIANVAAMQQSEEGKP